MKIADLEKVCAHGKEVCIALRHTMFLGPWKIQVMLEDVVKKAVDFEKKRNSGLVRV